MNPARVVTWFLAFSLSAGCSVRSTAAPPQDGGDQDRAVADEPTEGGPGDDDGGQAADAGNAADSDPGETAAATSERVVELTRNGQDARALAMLDRLPNSDPARGSPAFGYLRGRLLERLGRHGSAAAALEQLDRARLPARVAHDAEVRRASLLARAGQCKQARPLLAELSTRFRASKRKLGFHAADCALQLGDAETAVAELRAVAKIRKGAGVDSWTLRLKLAEALAQSKQAKAGEEAQQIIHDLLVKQPAHRDVASAEKLLRELGGDPGTFDYNERVLRAERMLKRNQFEAAAAELDAAKRPTRPAQLARWLHLKGTALYRSRHHYIEASKVLAEAARFRGRTAVDDEFHSARALSRADRDDDAIKAYRRLVKAHPRHARAAEAEYLAAWLDVRHGRKRGETRLKTFLDGPRGSRSDTFRREALWHLGFRAFEGRRYVAAAGYFDQYAKSGQGGLIRGRGLYWEGRALEALGRKRGAVTIYRQAIATEALHWYALLAKQRLEGMGEDVGHPFKRRARAAAPLPPLRVNLPPDVAFYASIGLDEEAQRSLSSQEQLVRASAPRGRELEAVIAANLRIGNMRRASRLAWTQRQALRFRLDDANRWVWEAAYPRPFASLVEAEGRERGVSPAHVYATMRQESGYSPRAVSRADAIGLLQMLPSVAENMARGMNVDVTREMLFDPRWNIRFGVAEIAQVDRDLGGVQPLTIAGYNAGVERVRRWLDETGRMELDRFVERIPFNETRNYVRRVTSHYARYRYLEDPSVPWPVILPQWVGPTKTKAR